MSSSSDARLKTNLTEVSGPQALRILSGITCQTYDAFGERRLGLIADEVKESIRELAIGSVVGSKTVTHEGSPGEYLTLQYERLVPLLVNNINQLSRRIAEIKSGKKRKMGNLANVCETANPISVISHAAQNMCKYYDVCTDQL